MQVTLILCTFRNLRLRRRPASKGLDLGRSRRARLEFVEGGGCGKHLARVQGLPLEAVSS